MNSSVALYAVSLTLHEGLSGNFDSGPYKEFPDAEFISTPSFVFRVDTPKPILMLDEMVRVVNGMAIVEYRREFDGVLRAARKYQQGWVESASTSALQVENKHRHHHEVNVMPDFKNRMIDALGLNKGGFDDVLERHLDGIVGNDLSSSDLVESGRVAIELVDSLMESYVHDYKYSAGDHEEVATQVANWARLRRMILNTPIDRMEQGPPSNATTDVASLAGDLQPALPAASSRKFSFTRPRG